MTKISSRELNQDISGAKNAAKNGPVIITDRGRPAHVLLTFEEYRRMTGGGRKIADLLAMPGVEDAELAITGRDELPRPADLS
jgi:prevent-host-death family protein